LQEKVWQNKTGMYCSHSFFCLALHKLAYIHIHTFRDMTLIRRTKIP